MLLKRLTETIGVSGNENEVRKLIIQEIKDHVDKLYIDKLGNIITYKKGKNDSKKIMISANMDELGMMVSDIDSSGLVKFIPVGPIDTKFLPSKRVKIGEDKVLGVIGSKPIHLQRPHERKNPIPRKSLYIDIGAKDKESASSLVQIGDYIGLESDYVEFGKDMIKAKFIESRLGCNILIDLLKKDTENSFYGVFTVMSTIGLVGASSVAFDLNPDLAIIIQAVSCNDYPGMDNNTTKIKLGKGPVISLYDKTTIYNRHLVKAIEKINEDKEIPIQYLVDNKFSNDAGKIHLTQDGIPTASISVPCRYINSPSSVINKEDYKNTELLLEEIIGNINNN